MLKVSKASLFEKLASPTRANRSFSQRALCIRLSSQKSRQ